jgi:transposase
MKCIPNVRHYDKIVNNRERCILLSIGFIRLNGHTNRKFTGEFKQKVVEELRQNNLSYKETARKYKLSDTLIAKWERIYLEEGQDGLYQERRGYATNYDNSFKGRKPKFDKKLKEDLITENQRLRMENEYFKKLNALVQQKEISKQKTKLR